MTPNSGGGYQTYPQVSLGWLSRGWEYFSARTVAWVGLSIVVLLVAGVCYAVKAVPAGVAAVIAQLLINPASYLRSPTLPVSTQVTDAQDVFGWLFDSVAETVLAGGLYKAALKQIRYGEFGIEDVLSVGSALPQLVVLGLLKGLMSIAGIYCCCIPFFIVNGLMMFAPLLVVDTGANAFQAIAGSFRMLQPEWTMAAVFYLLMSLFIWSGFCCFCVGAMVTYPVSYLATAYGYALYIEPYRQMQTYGAAAAGTWPPPPSVGPPPSFGLQPPFGQQQPQYGPPPGGGQQPTPPWPETPPATPTPTEPSAPLVPQPDFKPRQPRPPLNDGSTQPHNGAGFDHRESD